MTAPTLVLRYTAFAALASAANLGTQRVILSLGSAPLVFPAALGGGTAAGLFLKYLLDKRWIFRDPTHGFRAHGERFSRYTLMVLATTALFWGSETAFWVIWQRDDARELGALLGLGLGYFAKYHLDRRFVFSGPSSAA